MTRKTFVRKIFPPLASLAILASAGIVALAIGQGVSQGIFNFYPYGLTIGVLVAVFALHHAISSDRPKAEVERVEHILRPAMAA